MSELRASAENPKSRGLSVLGASAAEPPEPSIGHGENGRVLVVDDERLLETLFEAASAVKEALSGLSDWRAAGERPDQYHLDLVADAAAVEVLHGAGLRVLSEESGVTGRDGAGDADDLLGAGDGDDLLVVLDPVDGSTNASLGIPWFATSLCVLDGHGARVAAVVNQSSGTRFDAVRGKGARRDGRRLAPSGCRKLDEAVIGVSGLPGHDPGWAQFRALGSAALDHCAVAEGVLDGYRVEGGSYLHGWDYLGGMLVCTEPGAAVGELDGRDLVPRDAGPRRPVAAATEELLVELVNSRQRSARTDQWRM